MGSDYNIWVLTVASGELRQLTKEPSEDSMPSWSPDDQEIAFASTREQGRSIWAVTVADGSQRTVSTAEGTADAPSWAPGGQIVYHVTAGGTSRLEVDGRVLTGAENAFPFRVSWASPTEFVYVSDGRIRRRAVAGAQTSLGAVAQLVNATLGGVAR